MHDGPVRPIDVAARWMRTVGRRMPRVPVGVGPSGIVMGKVRAAPVVVFAPFVAPMFPSVAVDPNGVAAPVASIAQPEAHAERRSVGDQGPRVKIRQLIDEDDLRVVLRHIDHRGLSGNDPDVTAFEDNLLLGVVDQRAIGARAGPGALDRGHHVVRLVDVGGAELLHPLEVVVHPLDHLGIVRQPLHTVIPSPGIDVVWVAASVQITRSEHDIGARRGGRQDQRHERIRVQRDRRNQLLHRINGNPRRQRRWRRGLIRRRRRRHGRCRNRLKVTLGMDFLNIDARRSQEKSGET